MELVPIPLRIGTTTTATYLRAKVGGMMQTLLFPNGSLRSSAALFRPWHAGFQPAGAIHGKEITDIHLRCAPQRGESRLSVSIIKSEGNRSRRTRRSQPRDRSKPSKELKDQPAGDQDEIIALFRRIQSSLSKDGPTASTSRRRDAKIKKDKEIVELIPEFPRQEQARRGRRRDDEDDAMLSERSELSVGETADHAASPNDAKAARPVSSFVKKSPISRPLPLRQENNKDAAEQPPQAAVLTQKQLQNLDELKLPELKEIAKGKGVKRYSKMKKGELLQLLKGLSEST